MLLYRLGRIEGRTTPFSLPHSHISAPRESRITQHGIECFPKRHAGGVSFQISDGDHYFMSFRYKENSQISVSDDEINAYPESTPLDKKFDLIR